MLSVQKRLIYSLSIYLFAIAAAANGIKSFGIFKGLMLGLAAFVSASMLFTGVAVHELQKDELAELKAMCEIPKGR